MTHDTSTFGSDPLDPEQLLSAYFAGECSSEERARVEAWALEHSDRFALSETVWCRAQPLSAPNPAAFLARMQRAVEREHDERPVVPSIGEGARRSDVAVRRAFWRKETLRQGILSKQTLRGKVPYVICSLVAASIIAVLSTGLMNNVRTPFVGRQTYTTAAGQNTTVTLTDGSLVQLGPMTTLAVRSNPAERRVEVRVSGEAFFSVAHRSNALFQVRTGNAIARVLGTTFFVRRYPVERITQVVVADGRISLTGAQNPVPRSGRILSTRMLGTVDDSGHVMVTPGIMVEDYTAWTTGRLVCHNTPILDVIAELSRAYNVEFRLADSALAERQVTGTLSLAQQSLTGVLAVLSGVLDAHPVRTGRIITFVPGRVASPQSPPSPPPEQQYGK